ncbi:unnamed protein product [marine sediment metagenome]|uniref:Uncharacterized protein n=1 Tax=marine sediment metagenome TaxID=412755 RepID=X0U8Z8_9ZZZZ
MAQSAIHSREESSRPEAFRVVLAGLWDKTGPILLGMSIMQQLATAFQQVMSMVKILPGL